MEKSLEMPINDFEQSIDKKEVSPRLEGLFKVYYDSVINFINNTPFDYEMISNPDLWNKRYFEAKKDAQIEFGQDALYTFKNDLEFSLEVRRLLDLQDYQIVTAGMLEELLPKKEYYEKFNNYIEYKKIIQNKIEPIRKKPPKII